MPTAKRGTWFALIVVALGAASGIGLAEAVARIAFPLPTRHYVWPPDATLEFKPDLGVLPGASPLSRYRTNAWGVRGRPVEDDGAYRILMIGGSAVECVYLDQPKSFPALIEQKFNTRPGGRRVWVGNAAKSGLNSQDHVQELRNLLIDLPRIDAVVVMTGVNDVSATLRDDPAEAARPVPEATLLARIYYAYPERSAHAPFFKRTGLWQLARRIGLAEEKLFPPPQLLADWTGRAIRTWREHRRSASRIRETPPDLAPALAAHRRDMSEMIAIARARGSRIVLVTQPALWRADLPPDLARRLWLGGVGPFMEETGHEYYSPGALAKALDAFNSVLLDEARARGAETFDLAVALSGDGSVFFDDCHVTESGSARVADLLAGYLSPIPVKVPIN